MKIETPMAESLRISLAGLTNSGKSSLMNNLFSRDVSIVSKHAGTTADPVHKKIELAQAGSAVIVDTAGIDDTGELGVLRVAQTIKEIASCDMIILVTPSDKPVNKHELEIIDTAERSSKPLIIASTFSDKNHDESKTAFLKKYSSVYVNNVDGEGTDSLRKLIIRNAALCEREITPLEGIVRENDSILLVVPIDLAAPKGRLIMPQVETIRDALDRDCIVTIAKERELHEAYNGLKTPPSLVITDSQVFSKTASDISPQQKLTSFSILFARKKGDLAVFIKGTKSLADIKPKSKILIFESCSHHTQPDDIGTVKIPRLFRQIIQSDTEFDFAHGLKDSIDYSRYSLAIFCGGCMQTRKQILNQIKHFTDNNVPVTNYGLFLAYVNGLLPRALEVFEYEHSLYTE